MQTKSRDIFATIRTEGALLPADLLQRIAEGDGDLEGIKPADYHLVEGEKLNEAISRSWNRLLAVWNSFRSAVDRLPEKDLGTTLTREKWLLPLFQELGYGRLPTSKAVEIEGKSYPISHFWQPAPIHLIGCRVDIDRRTAGVAGAARMSPHGLVQEFLNRSEPHLWAFVSNGLRLRILRDNVSLTRQAFVEFDLAGMMDGEVYSDFILLWLLCQQSRVEAPQDKSPEHCWLEKWSQAAQQRGTRVLDQLRKGVEEAIKALGSGFLSHLANTELKQKLKTGTLDKQEYYRQLLRTVYRLIFIFVSEDRGLLLNPQADQQAKNFYMQHYSATRLRKLAQKKRGTRHYDLWRGLSLVFDKLGSNEGCPELALPALGSFLWSKEAIADLDGCDISNRDLLEAVRALAFTVDNNILRAVDYKNLGSEELGSVYESLLELHPELNVDVGTFELSQVAGSERKTTGSYYTHSSLVNCLLDSALEPVLDEAVKKDNPEQAILNLKICDPAAGSGHFLVAAAHRMAKRLAAIRTGDDEPSPKATRMALRDVIGHCIYGVDINPMVAELCKVSLWLEAIEPGKPLSFIDHHVKCGNSLLGTTPALMEQGIPDDAFKPIEGDIKAICNEYKKQNKDERKGQRLLFEKEYYPWDKLGNLPSSMVSLDEMPDDTVEAVEQKRKKYAEIVNSTSYKYGHLLADAWCAAFIFPKNKSIDYPITEKIFREIEQHPHNIALWMEEEISRLKKQYQFFHWHLEFPDVFRIPSENEAPENEQTGWSGGFDCVLGNPPWERVQFEEQTFFADKNHDIYTEPSQAKRRLMIQKLKTTDPNLYRLSQEARRHVEGEAHFLRHCTRYPLTAVDKFNLYAIFSELAHSIHSPYGFSGLIVKAGLLTDKLCSRFFEALMSSKALSSVIEFENREKLFSAVDSRERFALVTIGNNLQTSTFSFDNTSVSQGHESEKCLKMTFDDILLFSPNTKNCLKLANQKDFNLARKCYLKFSAFVRHEPKHNPWNVSIDRYINVSDYSDVIKRVNELPEPIPTFFDLSTEYAPLYEGKLFNQFDHRFSSYSKNGDGSVQENKEKSSESQVCFLRYVPTAVAVRRNPHLTHVSALLATRNITNKTNERSVIAAIIPPNITDYSVRIVKTDASPEEISFLAALLNSFAFDYLVRQRLGGTNLSNYILEQTPVPTPALSKRWLVGFAHERCLELTYTAWDLETFSKDCGYDGPPFVWDEERRFKIRSELDAAYFHLYLGKEEDWKTGTEELLSYFPTPRDAVDYIMETFPIVKRKDEAKYGSYRTKELILEIYDKMAEAIKTGHPYQTILEPPPGPPVNEKGDFLPLPEWQPGQPKPANWPQHIHPLKGCNTQGGE